MIAEGKALKMLPRAKVWKTEDGKVIKEMQFPTTFVGLAQTKADYEYFSKRLGDSVAKSYFVVGEGSNGKPTNLIIQTEIKGRALRDVPDEELKSNQELRDNLIKFFSGCLTMWDEDSRMPDIYGRFANPRATTNIRIEDATNKPYLTDIIASERYFSKNSPLPYRVINQKVIANTRSFIKNLNRQVTY